MILLLQKLMLFLASMLACLLLLAGLVLTACTNTNQPEISSSSLAVPNYDTRLDGLRVDNAAPSEHTKRALSNQQETYTARIQAEYQLPELPSGCEVTSLTMVLRSMGFTLSKTEIADNYLVVDGSERGFLASPYEDNGGGFPPGIVNAANAYLDANNVIFRAHDLTGSTFEALCALVDAGIPVCVWTTLQFNEPNYDLSLGATETWFVNEHCVVLYGATETDVEIANPLEGIQGVDRLQFASAYEACGSMALTIW